MPIKPNDDYFRHLHDLVTHALLHLLGQVSCHSRHVSVAARNAILVKYLKPKVNDKALSSLKKDIKLMLAIARTKGGALEMKLYELNHKLRGASLTDIEKFSAFLTYLYDSEGLPSQIFNKKEPVEPGVIYLLQDHIEHAFDAQHRQIAPISMLIQSARAPELVNVINQYGWFVAEMKEWNVNVHQAHLLVHPNHP